jgi:hypothetical protein
MRLNIIKNIAWSIIKDDVGMKFKQAKAEGIKAGLEIGMEALRTAEARYSTARHPKVNSEIVQIITSVPRMNLEHRLTHRKT